MKLNKKGKDRIESFLEKVNVPICETASSYLREVILEKINEPELTLGKAIEKVAKMHNKTSCAISRRLDRIVKKSAESMTPEVQKEIFYDKKVSLGRFVTYATYHLRNEL